MPSNDPIPYRPTGGGGSGTFPEPHLTGLSVDLLNGRVLGTGPGVLGAAATGAMSASVVTTVSFVGQQSTGYPAATAQVSTMVFVNVSQDTIEVFNGVTTNVIFRMSGPVQVSGELGEARYRR